MESGFIQPESNLYENLTFVIHVSLNYLNLKMRSDFFSNIDQAYDRTKT